MKVFFCLSLLLVHMMSGISQEAIFLTNPSFEGNPQYAAVPGGWRNCAFNNESPPDIHRVRNSTLTMDVLPYHGETFLGLLAKGNATTESIGQRLEQPLKKDFCYAFSIYMCKSPNYAILLEDGENFLTYDGSLVLRLWGGSSPCGKRSLLAVSPPVGNLEWTRYTFQFIPEADISYITLEAYFIPETDRAYRGTLMLDNASAFIPIDCAMKFPLVDEAALNVPGFQFKKMETPYLLKKTTATALEGNSTYSLDVRLVLDEKDLDWLVFDNCNRIGFRFSSRKLMDEKGLGLKEIAVNLMKHKSKKLIIGIQQMGKRLDQKRIKSIKRTFQEIGLSQKFYQVEILPDLPNYNDWFCGQKEIWLRLE